MPPLFPGVALVTGAASGTPSSIPNHSLQTNTTTPKGIGQATAVSFAREGCRRLVLADLNEIGLAETQKFILAESPDAEVLVRRTDVSSEGDVGELLEEARGRFGRVDYCANCAGM